MAARIAASASPLDQTPRRIGSVAKATGVMMALVLLSRVAGMLRDMVINHQFGISPMTDAYNAAFTIPDLLMYLIAGGALSSTFIPVFSEYLHSRDDDGAWETFSIVATVTILVAGVFVIAGEIWTPWLTAHLNPGYDSARVELSSKLTRIVLPAQIFFLLGGLLMGTLNARGQFLIPALGPTIYNLGIIFGATALHFMGIYGLMWGALGGAFVGNFALQIGQVAKLGMRYRPSLLISHPGAMKIWRLMLPILLGVSLPNIDQMVNKYFSSELAVGSQSAMQVAVRLMLIPIGVFAQAMGIAILPTLSAHAAAGQRMEMRKTVVHGLRTILFLTVPASVLMYVLAQPIIALLYQHGAFDAFDVQRTAVPLRFYALGIFAWSAQAILTRAFYAVQDSRTPVISGTGDDRAVYRMNWAVVHWTNFGVAGLAMATTIAATMHMIIMLFLLDRRLGRIANFPLLASVLKTLVSTAAMCAAVWGVREFLDLVFVKIDARVVAGLEVLICSLVGGIVFFLVAQLLRMSELEQAMRTATPLLGKFSSKFRGAGDKV